MRRVNTYWVLADPPGQGDPMSRPRREASAGSRRRLLRRDAERRAGHRNLTAATAPRRRLLRGDVSRGAVAIPARRARRAQRLDGHLLLAPGAGLLRAARRVVGRGLAPLLRRCPRAALLRLGAAPSAGVARLGLAARRATAARGAARRAAGGACQRGLAWFRALRLHRGARLRLRGFP